MKVPCGPPSSSSRRCTVNCFLCNSCFIQMFIHPLFFDACFFVRTFLSSCRKLILYQVKLITHSRLPSITKLLVHSSQLSFVNRPRPFCTVLFREASSRSFESPVAESSRTITFIDGIRYYLSPSILEYLSQHNTQHRNSYGKQDC